MKKTMILAAAVVMLFGLGACQKQGSSNKLVVWSFTDELDGMINNYFKKGHPDVSVSYSMTPSDQFPNKLDPVLQAGQGVPDVFALESDFVRKYVESGLLLDLTDIYENAKDKLLAYPVEIGSYEGRVYGMSWQAAPGALFYRRSLAKKYLGDDDPKTVQTYFTDKQKFMDTAKLLYDKSNGACVVISALGDLQRPFQGGRTEPWIVDDKLVIDPVRIDYMQTSKIIHDQGYEGRVGAWSEGWFAGMKGVLEDENGELVEVFSYFLPTWGLHYVLKTNAPDTAGDWAMIPGPFAYRWGGTWIGAWKNTKNPEGAKELIRYLTTDDDFLEAWAKDSGDLVSNINVVNKIKDSYVEPFLGGQNHYAEFAEMAKHVDGKLTQGTDMAIEGLFMEALTAYVNDEKSLDLALADFKDQVRAQLGYGN
ncbi:MAG: ABC transporter substrate-binding protein [Treponema sp.]|jgi:ABC-type glycerol-3-phosphate transport system substrate-binding protein|nr:ABC transporter substrate-binding protein [Treponema sp.]